MSKKTSSNSWTLITIDDPSFLSGKSLFDIIYLLKKSLGFKFVILNEIYGISKPIADLEKLENSVIEIECLLDKIGDVKQFDWGDFFLFKEKPTNWEKTDEIIYYPKLVVQSDTTIRAVDDQYIYVYTPFQEVSEIILKNYKIESIKTGPLDTLEFPY